MHSYSWVFTKRMHFHSLLSFSALLPGYTLLSFFFTSCHCIHLLYSLIQANDVGVLAIVMSILYFHENLYEFPLVPICGGQYWWELIYLRYTKMKCPIEWKINLTSSFLLWRYTSKCNEKLFEVASRLPLQWGSMAQSDNF